MLFFSVWKNSECIVGHGGVLDRFDSFLFSTPAVYYYILFVVKHPILSEPIDWSEIFAIRNVGHLF